MTSIRPQHFRGRGRPSNAERLLRLWGARGLREDDLLWALRLDGVDDITPDIARDAIRGIDVLERLVIQNKGGAK